MHLIQSCLLFSFIESNQVSGTGVIRTSPIVSPIANNARQFWTAAVTTNATGAVQQQQPPPKPVPAALNQRVFQKSQDHRFMVFSVSPSLDSTSSTNSSSASGGASSVAAVKGPPSSVGGGSSKTTKTTGSYLIYISTKYNGGGEVVPFSNIN